MKYTLNLLYLIFLLPFLYSCSNKLDVNAEWKDITVVYGLINQNDSIHYVKITKAFLGEGDALSFAQIADSSNYPDKLDVKIEEWRFTSSTDSSLHHTYQLDTTYITNKDSGVFYYPTQLVYYFKAQLDTVYTYKLIITNKNSGKLVTAQTKLIQEFLITNPREIGLANILPAKKVLLDFNSAVNGRRYQLNIRLTYDEYRKHGTIDTIRNNSVTWVAFDNWISASLTGNTPMSPLVYGDGLYSTMSKNLTKVYTTDTTRHATSVDFIFTVATDDLNTYMNVTAPSNSIVQERPAFTNIINGIGLFTSRYDNTKDSPRHLGISQLMQDSIKAYSSRNFLGF
jgi:hypothetical protein